MCLFSRKTVLCEFYYFGVIFPIPVFHYSQKFCVGVKFGAKQHNILL